MSITPISAPSVATDMKTSAPVPPPVHKPEAAPTTSARSVAPVGTAVAIPQTPVRPPSPPPSSPSSMNWKRTERQSEPRPATGGEAVRPASEEWSNLIGCDKAQGKETAEANRANEEKETLGRAVQQMNEAMLIFKRDVGFKIVSEHGESYVEVFDKNTEQTIRRMPPEDLLHKIERIKNDLGYLIDEQG